MTSLQRAVSRLLPAARTSVVLSQVRNSNVVSGPPTVRVSFTEKVLLGGSMVLSVLIIPAWVLVNVKHYKARH